MLVSGQGEEGIPPVHEVTAKQGIRVHDGGLSADDRPSMQVDHKEDLLVLLHGSIQLLRQVVGNIGHAGLLLVGAANAAFVFVGLLVVLFSWHSCCHPDCPQESHSLQYSLLSSFLLLLVLAP